VSHIVDKVIEKFQKGNYDYVCNTLPPTYPDGLDVEVFSFATLERAWTDAGLKSEREHVTPYMRNHSELFTIKNVSNEVDLSEYHWTLDTTEDLEFIRKVAKEICQKSEYCGLKCIVGIIKKNPKWSEINIKYKRNEGYQKSLREDK